jgi:hypothetical protein
MHNVQYSYIGLKINVIKKNRVVLATLFIITNVIGGKSS